MRESQLSGLQREQLVRYRDLLLEHNRRINLTAIRDPEGIDRRLIEESLRLLPIIDDLSASGDEVVDIGTGGGVPGMPLAIARPELRWTLIDATAKKVAFLQDVVSTLSLPNVVLYHGRIEELAHESHLRGRYRVLTARAVASLPALLELGLPMVRVGGALLLPKGLDIDEELAQAAIASRELGGRIVSHDLLPDAGTGVDTRLMIAEKLGETPAAYPRRAGIPARSPLGG
ncbi:MAG TPA: 16S rRNA (guanine(527)-N(7))-methyltransferase RsmG [Thermomicrobiales bacterium]|nr:16S rRNA (guanine(527)-N(7))-methyltransferase RsmG [Thermomicrobiales bacterium]